MMDWGVMQQLVQLITGVASTVAILTWWLSLQFNKYRGELEKGFEKLLGKLEYHERHDDDRFSELRDDLWEIRLRVAANKIIATNLAEDNFDKENTHKRRQTRTSDTSGIVA